jgi:hypothetical protein
MKKIAFQTNPCSDAENTLRRSLSNFTMKKWHENGKKYLEYSQIFEELLGGGGREEGGQREKKQKKHATALIFIQPGGTSCCNHLRTYDCIS